MSVHFHGSQSNGMPQSSFFTRRTYPRFPHVHSIAKTAFFFATYSFTKRTLEKGHGNLSPLLKINNGFASGACAGTLLAAVRYPLIRIDRPLSSFPSLKPLAREIFSLHAWQGIRNYYPRHFVTGGVVGIGIESMRLLAKKASQH